MDVSARWLLASPLVAMWMSAAPAAAGSNDLDLLNLCDARTPAAGTLNGPVPECTWVRRASSGLIDDVVPDDDANSRFRSLMSELGVVMAPRLMVPAETLGYAGFQLSAEIGTTSISAKEPFWKATQGAPDRPSDSLTTVGAFVRKGLWIPLPAFEVGAGVVHLLDSQMIAWQGYAKFALHEGFHDWPLPSVAVRGSASYLTGSDQVKMTVTGLDIILSKGFGLLRTARLEPFGGWSFLWISATASPFDTTPSCDAHLVRTAAAGQPLGDYCSESQRGTANDLRANFTFEAQDVITRHRFFGGAKLKFGTVFLVAQYEYVPPGRSRDERRQPGARDGSGAQTGLSLSAGFDF